MDETAQLIAAWVRDAAWMSLARVAPERAKGLFLQRLAEVDEGGAWTFPGVLVAGSALAEALGTEDEDFPKRLWAAAPGMFEEEVARFDPASNGLVRWPGEDEAVALDALVLLAEDARLCLQLAKTHRELLPQAEFARSTLNESEGWVGGALWNDDSQVFLRRVGAGGEDAVEDGSSRPFWALEWRTAWPDMVDAVLGRHPGAADDVGDVHAAALRLVLASRLLGGKYKRVCAELLGMEIPGGAEEAERQLLEEVRQALLAKTGSASCTRMKRVGKWRSLWWGAAAALLPTLAAIALWLGGKTRAECGASFPPERLALQKAEDGDFAAAAALYGEAAQQAETGNGRLAAFFQQANCLLKAGELAKAEAEYRRLLGSNPDLPSVRFNLGCCLWRAGRTAEAIEVFQELGAGAPSATEDLLRRSEKAATYLATLAK